MRNLKECIKQGLRRGVSMGLKRIVRKIVYGYKADSESYIKFLRMRGAKIGKNCVVFEPTNTSIDVSRPYLIEIGDNVQITKGVTILTHGYDWSVLKGVYGEVLGNAQPVKIGNNVFIGRNATIMGNVLIGDNVIVGAGTVVTKSIPSNSVCVGVPAKVICTLEEYYKKRKREQIKEAKQMAKAYYEAFGMIPPKEEFREFFWLFEQRKNIIDNDIFAEVMKLCGNEQFSYNAFMKTTPSFENYETFIKACELLEKE